MPTLTCIAVRPTHSSTISRSHAYYSKGVGEGQGDGVLWVRVMV